MVGRISESRTFFYRDHEINMASSWEDVSMNIDHFYLVVFEFVISNPPDKFDLVLGWLPREFLTLNLISKTS